MYTIQSYPNRWYVVCQSRFEQHLIGCLHSDILHIHFGLNGILQRVELVRYDFVSLLRRYTYPVPAELLTNIVQELCNSDRLVLKICDKIIVDQFYIDDVDVGILQFPDFFADSNDVNSGISHLDKEKWSDSGNFVLKWCGSIWIDKQGRVIST